MNPFRSIDLPDNLPLVEDFIANLASVPTAPEDEETCPICVEEWDHPIVSTSCNHTFHKKCLAQWLRTLHEEGEWFNKCPFDRKVLCFSVWGSLWMNRFRVLEKDLYQLVTQAWKTYQRKLSAWSKVTASPKSTAAAAPDTDVDSYAVAAEAASFVRNEWRSCYPNDEGAWVSDAVLEHLAMSMFIEVTTEDHRLDPQKWLALLQYRDTYTKAMYDVPFPESSAESFYINSHPDAYRFQPEHVFQEDHPPRRVSASFRDTDGAKMMGTDGYEAYPFQEDLARITTRGENGSGDRVCLADCWIIMGMGYERGTGFIEVIHSGRSLLREVSVEMESHSMIFRDYENRTLELLFEF